VIRQYGTTGPVRLGVAALVVGLLAAGCGSDDGPGSTSPDPTLLEPGALTVCTSFPYRPFEFMRGEEPAGFDIDLANEVAKRLEVTAKFENVGFDNIASGRVLNEGRCDVAAAALTINGERARALDFSSPYFFEAGQAMVVQDGSGIRSLADLSGLQIGVQGGTTGEQYVADNAPDDTEIVPLDNAGQMDAALNEGEVDAAVYDSSVVDDVLSRFPDFEVVTEFPTGEQYGMAVKKNSNVDLLRVINDVISDLRANGGYNTIYNRWFDDPSI
jgi:polar amino acid transport system substrate-binding protein